MKYVIFGIIALLLTLAFTSTMGVISWSNTEVALRQQVLAQEKANTAEFDNMWKTISQQAQVSDKYKDSFKEIFIGIMEKRYENNKNITWQWMSESNPQFSQDMFERLMVTIESKRDGFTLEQKKLIDLGRAHTTMISQFPGSLWASILGRNPIDLKIVTSAKTESAFSTEREDSVKVF